MADKIIKNTRSTLYSPLGDQRLVPDDGRLAPLEVILLALRSALAAGDHKLADDCAASAAPYLPDGLEGVERALTRMSN